MCLCITSSRAVCVFVVGKRVQFWMMRGIVVCGHRPIQPLIVISVVVVYNSALLDSDHFIDIQIRPVKEMETRTYPAEMIRNPLKWGIRFDANNALVLFEEAVKRGIVVVNSIQALTVFCGVHSLRRILYE